MMTGDGTIVECVSGSRLRAYSASGRFSLQVSGLYALRNEDSVVTNQLVA
jgi:hypothetical protein